jgi:hypothetical protein
MWNWIHWLMTKFLANECGNVTYGFIKPEERFDPRTDHGQSRDGLVISLARLPSATGKPTCSLLNNEGILRYWIPIQLRIMTRVYGHFRDWGFGHYPSPDVTTLTPFWRLELPSSSGDTQYGSTYRPWVNILKGETQDYAKHRERACGLNTCISEHFNTWNIPWMVPWRKMLWYEVQLQLKWCSVLLWISPECPVYVGYTPVYL